MNLIRTLCTGACLLLTASASAQLSGARVPGVAPTTTAPTTTAPTTSPPAAAPQIPATVPTQVPSAVPAGEEAIPPEAVEKLDTAPSLEQQNDLPDSPDVDSAAPDAKVDTNEAVKDSAPVPAEQTEAMPNAVTSEAESAPTANAHKQKQKQKDYSWRYRWHDGHWWYWMPNKTWMIWEGARWTKYTDYLSRFDPASRRRGAGQPGGQYYNGQHSSGYRGTAPQQRYYQEYRPVWSDDGYDYIPDNRPLGYDYWPGWRGGPGFGSYNSPLNSGTFQGGLGAGAGGGIGAAAVAGS